MTDTSKSDHVVIEMPPLASAGEEDRGVLPPTTPAADIPWTTTEAPSRMERDEKFDMEMLQRTIGDTGRWAFGTIAVEAWVLNESTGKLVRPPMGLWVDPVLSRGSEANEAVLRLVDTERPDHVGPDPLAPGIGLPGVLWSDLARNASGARNMQNVVWRDLESIRVDPDQPYNLRLKLSLEAGIGLVAGVPYHFRNTRGLVLYMARKTADITKLKSKCNTDYLLSATDAIGSIVALSGRRRACLAERRKEREDVRRRLRLKMVAVVRIKGTLLKEGRDRVDQTGNDVPVIGDHSGHASFVSGAKLGGNNYCGSIKGKFMMVLRKCKGANNEPPPPMGNFESIWTFCGVFVSLLMLLYFSDAIAKRNPQYSLVLGPFGALMTLQYGLTAAPASQPRNAVLGQVIALSIALGMTYTKLETNVRRSLGTALAISAMTRLGITHPPAGAAALIFTGGGYNWGHLGIMLAGNVLAIFSATVINDMNATRQYPTFWGFGYWYKHFGYRKRRIE